ncbi:hypothetical protein QUB56_15280 [Microcoleus sp. AR_TQ3_B6]|uniref:hypothetical protein n=1 Tax=Microcoleus sp. AR_TQ3_B6 TaxID=3055284 RepID=UPI002FCEF1BF
MPFTQILTEQEVEALNVKVNSQTFTQAIAALMRARGEQPIATAVEDVGGKRINFE